jgi:hypothetical protein
VSTWVEESLRCPACAHGFVARVVRGAHVTRAPQLRDAALRGALGVIDCPACARGFAAPGDLVYTDFDRGHWIHVAPAEALARWPAVERDALDAFDRALRDTSPLAAPLAARFRVRIVFDSDELRERLACWDAGVDDALVECVKLRCLRERPDVRRPDERLRLYGVADDGALSLGTTGGARWTVPRAARDAIAADAAAWQLEFPALFGHGFVSCDRYLRGEAADA